MFFRGKKKIDDYMTIEILESSRNELKKVTLIDKKNVRILFLDDDGFNDNTLKSLGYLDIEVREKYERLSDFENFDIIFCDIDGIAKEVDEVYQGAALAKLIKKTYPSKKVLILRDEQQNLDFYDFIKYVDGMLPKNIENSKLSEKIDEYINSLNDPIELWRDLRKKLGEQGTSPKYITILEDYYVRGILNNENTIELMNQETQKINIHSIVSIVGCAIDMLKVYLDYKK